MQRKGRIQWLAILVGYLVDMTGSMIIAFAAQSIDPSVLSQSMFASTTGVVTAFLLVLMTTIGGFVAGRIAQEERFLHGFMVGGIGIIMLLIDSLVGTVIPLENILLQCCATLLGGLAGYGSRWTTTRQRE